MKLLVKKKSTLCYGNENRNRRRNIHFYVNVCGFHITEFFNEKHPMPDTPDDFVGDGNEGMFEFEKANEFVNFKFGELRKSEFDELN